MTVPTTSPRVVRVLRQRSATGPSGRAPSTGAGPLETSTVTALPTCSSFPRADSVAITCPLATFALACALRRRLEAGLAQLLFAWRRRSARDVRQRGAGRARRTRRCSHAHPFARLPPAGDWLMTSRSARSRSTRASGDGMRPARRSAAPATCSLCPTTSGTVTVVGLELEQHQREHGGGEEQQRPERPQQRSLGVGRSSSSAGRRSPRRAGGGREQQRAGAAARGPSAALLPSTARHAAVAPTTRAALFALALQRGDELVGVGVARGRILGERAQDDRVERRRHAGLSSLGGRGSAETCLNAIATAVSPSNGTAPVSSSYRITPTE